MPVEIDLGMPPAGYAVTSARASETVSVQFREFTSTEDGQHFIQRLEGVPNDILQKLPAPIPASRVDHMLALCRRDGSATVYLNELELQASVRASRPIEEGEAVTRDDFVDVERLELGVKIPKDVGALFVFSVGWRKGLFYDFGPVGGPSPRPREGDIAAILGRCYCHVLFQERFGISDTEWRDLFEAHWFPFTALRAATIDKLLGHVRSGWEPDELLDDIVVEVKGNVPRMLQGWRNHSSFKPHLDIIERAVDGFQNDDDYIGCAGLLYPRIKEIRRTHLDATTRSQETQKAPAQPALVAKLEKEESPLLPRRFQHYLDDVYLPNFPPTPRRDTEIPGDCEVQGTTGAPGFDRKSAVIGILVFRQLFYILENRTNGSYPNRSS